jgi:hypothetical protein
MDTFEALQAIYAKRAKIGRDMDRIKKEILAETNRAYSFYLMQEIQDLYDEVKALDAEVDRLIAEM